MVNTLADMTTIRLADPAGETIEWQLKYTNLSDAEASNLQQFYLSTEGSLNVFTFLDPLDNLFAWSDQLTNDVWTPDPFLSLTGGVTDPMGGTDGWNLGNSGLAPQGISQTLNVPGAYSYCFSAYVQAAAASTASLMIGSKQGNFAVEANWSRISFTGQGDSAAGSITFGLQIPPGAALSVFGMQAEAQPGASVYKSTIRGGVYQAAYFRDNTLTSTSTDMNHNTVTVNIAYASTVST